ncbi:MAG: VWA domain-containing protein [Planctomycetota bacterium]
MTTPPTNNHTPENTPAPGDTNLTDYALGELDPATPEHAAIEALLAAPGPEGDAARAELESIRATAADLTAALAQEPTPDTKPRMSSAVSATPDNDPSVPPAPIPIRNWPRRLALAASLAAAAALGVALLWPEPINDPAETTIANPSPTTSETQDALIIQARQETAREYAADAQAAADKGYNTLAATLFAQAYELDPDNHEIKSQHDAFIAAHPGVTQLSSAVDTFALKRNSAEVLQGNSPTAHETRVYDIRDLLVQVPNFTDGPEFDLNEALSNTNSGDGGNPFGGDPFGGTALFGDDETTSLQQHSGTQVAAGEAGARRNRHLYFFSDPNSDSGGNQPQAEPRFWYQSPGEAGAIKLNRPQASALPHSGTQTEQLASLAKKSEIPYNDLIGFPEDWPELSDQRLSETFGLEEGVATRAVELAQFNSGLQQDLQMLAFLEASRDLPAELHRSNLINTDQQVADDSIRLIILSDGNLEKQIIELRQRISQQVHNTEAYDRVEDNPFLAAIDNPLSTFSVDVDTASYANVRRFIDQGQLPPADAVRIEELVNYFEYGYEPPAVVKDAEEAAPFAAHVEVTAAPWTPEHRLVRIGIKGMEIATDDRPAANLVFLLDVSGSMNNPQKLPLVKAGMKKLVGALRMDDRVAIVVYAGASGLVLDSTSDHDAVLAAIDNLTPGGSTNGAAGIQLAYDIATQNHIEGGLNRVILCTDGDFNVGITDRGALTRLIEDKANAPETPTYLTVLGFGTGNLKDATMEELSNVGDGNYGYVDSLAEAEKLLAEQVNATLLTIAKDVKVQVEFNPANVASYRLIGYENRILAKEDFNNDVVDAGDIGAGHTVTALYEVIMADNQQHTVDTEGHHFERVYTLEEQEQIDALQRTIVELTRHIDRLSSNDHVDRQSRRSSSSVDGRHEGDLTPQEERNAQELVRHQASLALAQATHRQFLETLGEPVPSAPAKDVDRLKYQKPAALSDAADSDELLTLKLRYKQPDAAKVQGTSKLMVFPVEDASTPFAEASEDTRFAAAVAGFGMLLRGSPYAGGLDFAEVHEIAMASAEPWFDRMGLLTPDQQRRQEFIHLIRKADALSRPAVPAE